MSLKLIETVGAPVADIEVLKAHFGLVDNKYHSRLESAIERATALVEVRTDRTIRDKIWLYSPGARNTLYLPKPMIQTIKEVRVGSEIATNYRVGYTRDTWVIHVDNPKEQEVTVLYRAGYNGEAPNALLNTIYDAAIILFNEGIQVSNTASRYIKESLQQSDYSIIGYCNDRIAC